MRAIEGGALHPRAVQWYGSNPTSGWTEDGFLFDLAKGVRFGGQVQRVTVRPAAMPRGDGFARTAAPSRMRLDSDVSRRTNTCCRADPGFREACPRTTGPRKVNAAWPPESESHRLGVDFPHGCMMCGRDGERS